MKKILKIDSSIGFGGGQKVMVDIVESLKNDFHFIYCVSRCQKLDKYQGSNKTVLNFDSSNFIKKIIQIRKAIKTERPDIIHCHGTRSAFLGRIAVIGLKNRPKLIYTLHGLHLIHKPLLAKSFLLFFEKLLNNWTDVLVCVGEDDRDLVLKYNLIQPEKIRIIRNGIEIDKFRINDAEKEKLRKELGLNESFVVSSIARLHPQKDISTFFRAIKKISDKIRNLKVLIVGEGPLREKLEKEARNLGIKDNILFLGFRKDINILIALSDIIVLSTNWEGFPLTPLESSACKKPIIASNIGGVRETIIDQKTGLLFKKGSGEDLAKKILKLYSSKDLREKMGQNGYDFVAENFTNKRMVNDYKKLYKSILNEENITNR